MNASTAGASNTGASAAGASPTGRPPAAAAPAFDFGLARRQLYGIFRLELRNHLLSRRGFALYFLAFAPVLLVLVWAMWPARQFFQGPEEAAQAFALIYTGYLATALFLGCLLIFMSLFRSEILERSLHYYFLTPVRRQVLVLGKYFTALAAISAVFLLGTAMLYLLAVIPWGYSAASHFLFDGPGLRNLFTYLGITLMACIGYGAIFQLAGLIFRNPIVPAAIVGVWEGINFLLPAWLKKISVIFYLASLFPVPIASSTFSIVAEPTSAWYSVPGLLIFTAVVLAITGWWARRMELNYGAEE